MAITKTTWDYNTASRTVEEIFAGRVVAVEQRTETRNWSDTMDYTDYRSTECTYALVWLGTHNVPPTTYRNDPRPMLNYCVLSGPSKYNTDPQPRELEYFEQFAWVDCTNIFSDRNCMHLTPKVDGELYSFGDPLMWANYVAWQAYRKAFVAELVRKDEERAQERKRLIEEAEAKAAAKAAKKEAKDAALKAAAEGMLARAPQKGATVTVGGFTGTVFWRGATKYYGKWNARIGVKNAKGDVQWIDVAQLGV